MRREIAHKHFKQISVILVTTLSLFIPLQAVANLEQGTKAYQLLELTFGKLQEEHSSPFYRPLNKCISKPGTQEFTPEDLQKMNRWLESHKEHIALIDQAIEIGVLSLPELQHWERDFSDVTGLGKAHQAKLVQACYLTKTGQLQAGVNALVASWNLAQMLQTAPNAQIVDFMLGIACEERTFNAINMVLDHPSATHLQLEMLSESLDHTANNNIPFLDAITEEIETFTLPTIKDQATEILRLLAELKPDHQLRYNHSFSQSLFRQALELYIRQNIDKTWPKRDPQLLLKLEEMLHGVKEDEKESAQKAASNFYKTLAIAYNRLQEDPPPNGQESTELADRLCRIGCNEVNFLTYLPARLYTNKTIFYTFDNAYTRFVSNHARRNMLLSSVAPGNRQPVEPELRLDPFTEMPLHILQTKHKITIWSNGVDGIDNHGDPDKDIVMSFRHNLISPSPSKN